MGFSRRQAVDALEACDYDVQKALNSLLGAQ
jgi:epidermal growth factor receptor substrate 15